MLFRPGPVSVPLGQANRNERFSMKKALTGTCAAALLLALAIGADTPTAFAAEPNCRAIESTGARLSCYDAAFPPKTRKPAETSIDSLSDDKDPFLAEEARTAAKLTNICRGC